MTDHPTAPVQDDDVDSGMSGDVVARAEWLWVNLPTRIPWTSLPTHEKALVCHTLAALSPTPKTGLVEALKEARGELRLRGYSERSTVITKIDEALSNVLPDEVGPQPLEQPPPAR